MRPQDSSLQRRATPHSRPGATYDVPRSGLTILVNKKISKMPLYVIGLTLQSSGQLWFLG